MSERPHVDPDEAVTDATRRESEQRDKESAVPVENDEASDPLEVRFPDEEGNEHLESG